MERSLFYQIFSPNFFCQQKPPLRFLYFSQVISILFLLLFYLYVYVYVNSLTERYEMLKIRLKTRLDTLQPINDDDQETNLHILMTRMNDSDWSKPTSNHSSSPPSAGGGSNYRRKHYPRHVMKAESFRHPVPHDTWLQLSSFTKVQKSTMIEICAKVHLSCTEKGKKLRGAPGKKGAKGPSGILGLPGKRGPVGTSGMTGLPGPIGPPGRDGVDGQCNCSFPDVFIKKVPVLVSGPPTLQFVTVSVEVPSPPIVVIKEVTLRKPYGPPVYVTRLVPGPTRIVYETVTVPVYVTTPELTPPPRTRVTWRHLLKPTVKPGLQPDDKVRSGKVLAANESCLLDSVGTPILHAESPFGPVGSWMRDARPHGPEMESKRWVIDGYASSVLYEYKDELDLIRKRQLIKYYLNYLVVGTGAVIYNGSLYYHRYNSPTIVRYDLNEAEENITSIPDMAYKDCDRKANENDENNGFQACNESERHQYLYGIPHNYADFATDENGLWVIYANLYDQDVLSVAKLSPNLDIVARWNLNAENITRLANVFIMCGVLYGLRSSTDEKSSIDFAYDLLRNRQMDDVVVKWQNPFSRNSMLNYNPHDRRLYFYDSQNLLSTSVGVNFD